MVHQYIIGIDEVGRGPLAGPITVGAVAAKAHKTNGSLHPKLKIILKNIKDSKKLSPKQREEWRKKIKSEPRFYTAVASVGPSMIDRLGISRAATIAVGRCLKKLSRNSFITMYRSKILLDGSLYAPRAYYDQKTIIKGDEKIPIIAAASIMAKVYRDKRMLRYHRQFPEYRFDLHKGYGTSLHCERIRQHGISDIHRETFCKNI